MRIIILFLSSLMSLFTVIPAFATEALPSPQGVKIDSLPTPHNVTQNLDGVAAIVNNEVITQSELETAFQRAKQQMIATRAQNINDAQLKNALLQQLINEKLQLQMAKQAGITVSEAQVTQAIAHIAQVNHLTIKQLESKLQADNITLTDYKNVIRKQLIIHQVQMDAVGPKVQITDQDVQEFLAKNGEKTTQARRYHILDMHVPIESDSKTALDKAKQTATQWMTSWKKGTLAQQPTDLGWQSPDTLPTLFLTQLNHMNPGEIAGPILAPNGFHVIKLVAIKNKTSSDTQTTCLSNFFLRIATRVSRSGGWMSVTRPQPNRDTSLSSSPGISRGGRSLEITICLWAS